MSKMSDMTEYHASAYRLPSGFEHCSKLKPVAEEKELITYLMNNKNRIYIFYNI